MQTASVPLQPVKEYVRPARQLHLSEAALAEEHVCLLTAANPAAPANVTRYVPQDRAYRRARCAPACLLPMPGPRGTVAGRELHACRSNSAEESKFRSSSAFMTAHHSLPTGMPKRDAACMSRTLMIKLGLM